MQLTFDSVSNRLTEDILMVTTVLQLQADDNAADWVGIVRALGNGFAERAAEYDRKGEFVTDNYRELRAERVFAAGIPTELGGGGCRLRRAVRRHP